MTSKEAADEYVPTRPNMSLVRFSGELFQGWIIAGIGEAGFDASNDEGQDARVKAKEKKRES